MSDWDLTSIGIVPTGCSVSAAGIVMAAMLSGIFVYYAPFLLFTTIVLAVVGAAVIISIGQTKEKTDRRRILTCR